MEIKYILLNLVKGNAPILRGLEFVSMLNSRTTAVKYRAILPGNYTKTQKDIIREEFSLSLNTDPNFVVFDHTYGQLINIVQYDGGDYTSYLATFSSNIIETQNKINRHFKYKYIQVKNIYNDESQVLVDSIAFVFSRNPVVIIDLLTINVTIVPYKKIIQNEFHSGNLSISSEDLSTVLEHFTKLRDSAEVEFIPEPSTFLMFPEEYFENSISIPPNISHSKYDGSDSPEGFYLNISGITGLNQPKIALSKGLYTSKSNLYPYQLHRPPSVLSSKGITAQIARAGWGSIWNSIIYAKPFFYLKQDYDDLEIQMNQKWLDQTGWSEKYSDERILEQKLLDYTQKIKEYRAYLLDKFGSLDGTEIIIRHLKEKEIIDF